VVNCACMPDRLLTQFTTGAGVDEPAAVKVPLAVIVSFAFSVSVASRCQVVPAQEITPAPNSSMPISGLIKDWTSPLMK
jgi:hypothetical protein